MSIATAPLGRIHQKRMTLENPDILYDLVGGDMDELEAQEVGRSIFNIPDPEEFRDIFDILNEQSKVLPLEQKEEQSTPKKLDVLAYKALPPKQRAALAWKVQGMNLTSPREVPRNWRIQEKTYTIASNSLADILYREKGVFAQSDYDALSTLDQIKLKSGITTLLQKKTSQKEPVFVVEYQGRVKCLHPSLIQAKHQPEQVKPQASAMHHIQTIEDYLSLSDQDKETLEGQIFSLVQEDADRSLEEKVNSATTEYYLASDKGYQIHKEPMSYVLQAVDVSEYKSLSNGEQEDIRNAIIATHKGRVKEYVGNIDEHVFDLARELVVHDGARKRFVEETLIMQLIKEELLEEYQGLTTDARGRHQGVKDLCGEYGISTSTLYRWKAQATQ